MTTLGRPTAFGLPNRGKRLPLRVGSGLHIEKVFDSDGIASELETYLSLVPDSTNRKATMLIEYWR